DYSLPLVIQARCAGLDSNIFNDKTLQVFLLNGIGLIVQARSPKLPKSDYSLPLVIQARCAGLDSKDYRKAFSILFYFRSRAFRCKHRGSCGNKKTVLSNGFR
ncbi:MAG: hypothetical protein LIO77_09935, partial [Rikenellaceae bacterium]|nr:hypothetical protein [Rikenellaceae bacterium]